MPDVIASNADELLKLEDRSAIRVSLKARRELEAIGKVLLTEWAKLPKPPTDAALVALRGSLSTRLAALKLGPIGPTFDSILSSALTLGVDHAVAEVGSEKKPRKPRPDAASRKAIKEAGSIARSRIREGRRDIREATTLGEFTRAMAKAHGAVYGLERTARWLVNRGAATGAQAVAETLNASLLWVAERDACVHCLAYSGKVVKPGDDFPGGLTFGTKPLSTVDLPYPPLHPNCRCRVTPWSGSKRGVGDVEMPAALEREARRSILRGDALESEPESVRVAAARKLLAAGSGLPKSVETKARSAVKRGSFKVG